MNAPATPTTSSTRAVFPFALGLVWGVLGILLIAVLAAPQPAREPATPARERSDG